LRRENCGYCPILTISSVLNFFLLHTQVNIEGIIFPSFSLKHKYFLHDIISFFVLCKHLITAIIFFRRPWKFCKIEKKATNFNDDFCARLFQDCCERYFFCLFYNAQYLSQNYAHYHHFYFFLLWLVIIVYVLIYLNIVGEFTFYVIFIFFRNTIICRVTDRRLSNIHYLLLLSSYFFLCILLFSLKTIISYYSIILTLWFCTREVVSSNLAMINTFFWSSSPRCTKVLLTWKARKSL
jgi:hypothetical protein